MIEAEQVPASENANIDKFTRFQTFAQIAINNSPLPSLSPRSHQSHPSSSLFPTINWPCSPHECGYRRTHRSPIIVLRSVMKSLEAFHSLCAVVTFILSMWTKLESICVAPFRSAFWGLANHFDASVQQSWLDQFTKTHVCSLALSACTGCFIDLYTSPWGPWLDCFVRAGVQVWVVWGPDILNTPPSFSSKLSKFYQPFFPPLEYIESALSSFRNAQVLQFRSPFVPTGFPTQELQPPFTNPSPAPSEVSQPPPSSAEPPHPPPNSHQHQGETLAEILVCLAEGKRKHEALESLSDRQSRKDQEISAAQKGYSKTCTMF